MDYETQRKPAGGASGSSAGCRMVRGEAFPMLVMYPSAAPERRERIGAFEVDVAMDGAPAKGTFPLVLVSHGGGGSHLLYRGLMAHLARAGFVTLAPEHPRNNRNDNSLANTVALLEERPRVLRQALEWALADAALAPSIDAGAVGIVGHSMGAYAALALAGGQPTSYGHETGDGQIRAIPVEADARVRALVLLAPATPWFYAPGALAGVHLPILLVTAREDEQTPYWMAEIVLRGVADPALVEHEAVAGAGHLSFLAPFPESLVNPAFAPSQDPPGFDRAAFHEWLNERVLRFLRGALAVG